MRSVLLGAGGFGREVLPALAANDIEIAAVVDRDPAAIAHAVRSCGLTSPAVFESDQSDWWDTDAELVVDCTPPANHLRHAEMALRTTKDLLVAKPMALSLPDASRMVHLAATSGGRLATIQQMRYLPAFTKVRDLIREGSLGRLGIVTIKFNVDGMYWKPGLAWRLAMNQPVLMEGSIHVLDLVRWVTGDEPSSVVAHTFSPPWSDFRGPVGLTVCANMRSGAVVRYMANWAPRGSAITPLNSGWELEFDNGIVQVIDDGVLVNGSVLLPPRARPMSLADLNARLVRWYSGYLAGREAPGPTGEDNVATMAFADAVLRSATDGARVTL